MALLLLSDRLHPGASRYALLSYILFCFVGEAGRGPRTEQ